MKLITQDLHCIGCHCCLTHFRSKWNVHVQFGKSHARVDIVFVVQAIHRCVRKALCICSCSHARALISTRWERRVIVASTINAACVSVCESACRPFQRGTARHKKRPCHHHLVAVGPWSPIGRQRRGHVRRMFTSVGKLHRARGTRTRNDSLPTCTNKSGSLAPRAIHCQKNMFRACCSSSVAPTRELFI